MSFPNLSAIAVRHRSITLYFLLLSVVAGIYSFLSLGRAEDPAIRIPIRVITVLWPGASPAQIENQIVHTVEKKLQEVDYFDRLQTTIRPGRADIMIEFKDYTPAAKTSELQFQVRKRMLDIQSQLPEGALGPYINDDFGDVYFSLLSISAPGMPMRELAREAEILRDRLQRVPGVQKAHIIGERTERVFIDLDNTKLVNLGISAAQVFDAIDAHNRLMPAGQLETTGPRLYFRLDADLADIDKMQTMPIRVGNKTLRLGDIARIHQGYEDPATYMVRTNGRDALVLGVVMQVGENGLDLGKRLNDFLAQEKAELPLGMYIDLITNQADAITAAVDLFQMKFVVAVAVVMGVGFFALGFRAGLIVGISIPVTLGLTFLLMKFAGVNLDRITLGSLIIALGLMVDDAIIAIEMMLVKLEEGLGKIEAATFAWHATASPMLFGTLITIFGFVPIGFANSGVAEYAGNIFWVLAFSLLVSWLVAVTFTPYLGVQMLPDILQGKHKHADDIFDTLWYRRLRKAVTRCVEHRKKVVAITIGILVLSFVAMATVVEKQFFPSSDRPEVLVNIYMPQGTAIGVTDTTTRKLEDILHKLEGIKNFATYVGAGAPRFFISNAPELPNSGYANIVITAASDKDRDNIIKQLNQHIAEGEFTEARVRVSRLVFGPPVPWPVAFRVIGPDMQKIRDIAYEMKTVMLRNPQLTNANLEWDERVQTLHLVMDEDRLSLLGLTPRDVAMQLQSRLQGVPVTEVRQDIRTVKVWARGMTDNGNDEVQSIEIMSNDGRKIPLAQLGNIEVRYEEPVIKRFSREPFMEVRGDVIDGAQPPDVTMAIWKDLEALRQKLPSGYHLEISGSIEQSVKSEASINAVFPLMIVLMLTAIMLQMRSFIGTIMVLSTAPLGVIGAVFSLLVFQQPFGFVASLGLIGLAGILMRNTLILTQQVSDNMAEGMEADVAVIEAAIRRARPVILTALAAALAFLPLASDTFWGPLAYVLIGGVIIGTIITLLFVPALYVMFYGPGKKDAQAISPAR